MTRRSVPSAAQVRMWRVEAPVADPEPGTPAPTRRADTPILHGYTLARLDRLARRAVTQNLSWWRGADRHDQYDTAWSAIAEHLCTVDAAPTELDLIAVGSAALSAEANAYRHHHGIPRSGGGEPGSLPRFAAYWHEPPRDHWADAVVDRIALAQILTALSPIDRQTLTLVCAVGGNAASALGLAPGAHRQRLSRARGAFRQQWFAPEPPPPLHGGATRRKAGTLKRTHCSAGHELTSEALRWDKPRRTGWAPTWRCRVCESERSIRRRTAAGAV